MKRIECSNSKITSLQYALLFVIVFKYLAQIKMKIVDNKAALLLKEFLFIFVFINAFIILVPFAFIILVPLVFVIVFKYLAYRVNNQ